MGVKLIDTNFSSTDLALLVLKWYASYFSCHSEKILGSLNLRGEDCAVISGLRGCRPWKSRRHVSGTACNQRTGSLCCDQGTGWQVDQPIVLSTFLQQTTFSRQVTFSKDYAASKRITASWRPTVQTLWGKFYVQSTINAGVMTTRMNSAFSPMSQLIRKDFIIVCVFILYYSELYSHPCGQYSPNISYIINGILCLEFNIFSCYQP